MSYDDGSEHDRRLVDLFNRYGIRGTFHLNSGKLGQAHHITPQEVGTLYQGHEVSCHSVSHPYLTALADAELRHEIAQDRQILEDLTGAPVRGLAYPFGAYDDRLLALLPELGIVYARTAQNTGDCRLPSALLTWHPSCHHSKALALAEKFLQDDDPAGQVLFIWGHSYELDGFMTADPTKDWDYLEDLCRRLHGQDFIYYATALDLAEYLQAMTRLQYSATTRRVTNGSERALWIAWQTEILALPPGHSVTLA